MKTKIGIIFLIIVVIAVAIFVFQNSVEVSLVLYPGSSLHLPLSIVIICSIIVGILLMLIFFIGIEMRLRLQLRKLNKIIEKKNRAIELIHKGLIKLFHGNINEAKKLFNSSNKNDPDNFTSLLFLKDIESQQKKEEIINQLPVELRKFYLIEYFYDTGKFENLLEIGEELCKDSNFKNVSLLKKIKDAYLKLKNYQKAIEIQERLIKQNKDEKINLSKILYLKAKEDQNIKDIDNLIKKSPQLRSPYILKFNISKDLNSLINGFKKTNSDIFPYYVFQLYKENIIDYESCINALNKMKNDIVNVFISIVNYLQGNKEDAKKVIQQYENNQKYRFIARLILNEFDISDVEICEYYCKSCNYYDSKYFDICPKCEKFDSIDLKWKL